MGTLATCSALEMATGGGTPTVATLAMLCALEAALMAALGAHAAAVGAGAGVLATCDVLGGAAASAEATLPSAQ